MLDVTLSLERLIKVQPGQRSALFYAIRGIWDRSLSKELSGLNNQDLFFFVWRKLCGKL